MKESIRFIILFVIFLCLYYLIRTSRPRIKEHVRGGSNSEYLKSLSEHLTKDTAQEILNILNESCSNEMLIATKVDSILNRYSDKKDCKNIDEILN